MKIGIFIALLLVAGTIRAQIQKPINDNWSVIGNVWKTTIHSDGNNDDGINDGAILVNGQGSQTGQGIEYLFDGTMSTDQDLSISARLFNPNSSYVSLKVELFNSTSNTVLATSTTSIWSKSSEKVNLYYDTQASDNNDNLKLRFIRTDDGHSARDFAIDNVLFNGNFIYPSQPVCNDLSANWTAIGNTTLSMISSDGDNGDGVNDGAMFVDGKSAEVGQGVAYSFLCPAHIDQGFNIKTYVYNKNSSYVTFKIQLYNATDSVELDAVTKSLGYNGGSLAQLHYYASTDDVGDRIELKYFRVDDGNTARNFVIDYAWVNDNVIELSPEAMYDCRPSYTPNIALAAATAAQLDSIQKISERHASTINSGSVSESALQSALNKYDSYAITGEGEDVQAGSVLSESGVSGVLKTFAKYIKSNPEAENVDTIRQKALNIIEIVGRQFCDGTTKPRGIYQYIFHHYAEAIIPFKDMMSDKQKRAFGFAVGVGASKFKEVWNDIAPYSDNVYGHMDGLVGYGPFIIDEDQRLQYMKGVKRYMQNMLSYTYGRSGFIKVDGSSYHHSSPYVGYMYSFTPVGRALYALGNSEFQVSPHHYKVFRDALYYHRMISNDNRVMPLSYVGRNPHSRKVTTNSSTVIQTAIAGGKILGLSTADPVFAGYINRVWGVKPELNTSEIAPFESGFFQFNYSCSGIYRKNNWVVSMAGFTNNRFGAEIYKDKNFYGRYQSYGTLEIIYPGELSDNGFNISTWDWNYNPGTTTIVLPFDKLHSEKERDDEYQAHSFVGALAFENQGQEALSKITGNFGMFAMKFKQNQNQGWGKTWHSETHNNTFKFKKSVFAFDDMIVSLGSDINNSSALGKTVTTLFQRKTENQPRITKVNGADKNADGTHTFTQNQSNWVISNYNTGYYIVNGSGDLVVKKGDQQTPNYNQNLTKDWSNNPTENYTIGYLDHGTNPTNKGYEFVCVPSATDAIMTNLSTQMSQASTKPYHVYKKDNQAHIVKHKASSTYGFAIFGTGYISYFAGNAIYSSSEPCLAMYKNLSGGKLLFTMNNPNISVEDGVKTIDIRLRGEWQIEGDSPNASVINQWTDYTVVRFSTSYGNPIEITLSPLETTTKSAVIQVEEVEDKTTLYPNPVYNDLNISSNRAIGKIQIVDLAGRVVLTKAAEGANVVRISTSTINSGSYLTRIFYVDGKVEIKKFIKR